MKGDNTMPAKESVAESTLVHADKAGALEIISACGKMLNKQMENLDLLFMNNVVPF